MRFLGVATAACIAGFAAMGCATTFTGSPYVDGRACESKCRAQNMEVAGMVFMGEYSSACICEVPHANGVVEHRAVSSIAGGAGGGAAGVWMQMQAAQQQQHH